MPRKERNLDKLGMKAQDTSELFFDDVRVPVENLLGEENKGWSVAMATAGFERGLMLRSPARFQNTARKLVALYKEIVGRGERVDPVLRETVARAWIWHSQVPTTSCCWI